MRERFSEMQWSNLLSLPPSVFWWVSLADGKADNGERNCFLQHVRAATHVDPLFTLLCDELAGQGEAALKLAIAERDLESYFTNVSQVLRSALSPSERTSFFAALLSLGHHVADSSGGFFGMGQRISQVETARLDRLSEILGLSELLRQTD